MCDALDKREKSRLPQSNGEAPPLQPLLKSVCGVCSLPVAIKVLLFSQASSVNSIYETLLAEGCQLVHSVQELSSAAAGRPDYSHHVVFLLVFVVFFCTKPFSLTRRYHSPRSPHLWCGSRPSLRLWSPQCLQARTRADNRHASARDSRSGPC